MSSQDVNQAVVSFINDEDGATAIEYGLFAALISLVIIAAVTNIGAQLKIAFETIEGKITTAVAGATGGGS